MERTLAILVLSCVAASALNAATFKLNSGEVIECEEYTVDWKNKLITDCRPGQMHEIRFSDIEYVYDHDGRDITESLLFDREVRGNRPSIVTSIPWTGALTIAWNHTFCGGEMYEYFRSGPGFEFSAHLKGAPNGATRFTYIRSGIVVDEDAALVWLDDSGIHLVPSPSVSVQHIFIGFEWYSGHHAEARLVNHVSGFVGLGGINHRFSGTELVLDDSAIVIDIKDYADDEWNVVATFGLGVSKAISRKINVSLYGNLDLVWAKVIYVGAVRGTGLAMKGRNFRLSLGLSYVFGTGKLH